MINRANLKVFRFFCSRLETYRKSISYDTKSNSIVNVHVLANGYMNSPKSCVLLTGGSQILINCGEGTRRIIDESPLKATQFDHYLFTRFDWSTMGGVQCLSHVMLDNTSLNAADKVQVHSSIDFKSSYRIKRLFFSKEIRVEQHDYKTNNEYNGGAFVIKTIDMNQTSEPESKLNHTVETVEPQLDVEPKYNVGPIHTVEHKHTVRSYLIKIVKQEPHIIKNQIDRLTSIYKPGSWIGRLKKGIDYKSPSGEVLVKASDVLDYSNCVEKNVLVLDMPSVEGIKRVKSSILLNDESNPLDLIIHMAKAEILHSEPYMRWLREAYKTSPCIHLFLDETYPNIDMKTPYEFQAKLNLVDNRLFKLLPVQLDAFKAELETKRLALKQTQKLAKIVQGQTGMTLILRPKLKLELAQVYQLDNKNSRQEVFDYYDVRRKERLDNVETNEEKEIIEQLSHRAKELSLKEPGNAEVSKQSTQKYPRVVFLGTKSANPSKTRNVTSILVNTSPTKSVMLDCGDHTIGQMHKMLGFGNFDSELIKLKAILVSHNHPDHCSGLYGVIKARQQAFKNLNLSYEKVAVIFPNSLEQTRLFNSNLFFDDILTKDVIQRLPIDIFQAHNRHNVSDTLFEPLGLLSLQSVPVEHIPQSYGACLYLKLDEKSRFKLVYSGDCRPSDALVKAGMDCDLLIHECTFDNANQKKAVSTRHSTIGEALEVSKRMKAKHTLLTHFSARYSKFVVTEDMNMDNCAFAFDFMCVTPDEMNLLSKSTIARLNVIFKEKMIEYEPMQFKDQLQMNSA